jgi:hypothetical protein
MKSFGIGGIFKHKFGANALFKNKIGKFKIMSQTLKVIGQKIL